MFYTSQHFISDWLWKLKPTSCQQDVKWVEGSDSWKRLWNWASQLSSAPNNTTMLCRLYFFRKLNNLFWEFVVTLITNQSIHAIHVFSFFLFLTCSWCCYSLPIWIGQLQLVSLGVHFCKLKKRKYEFLFWNNIMLLALLIQAVCRMHVKKIWSQPCSLQVPLMLSGQSTCPVFVRS